MTVQLQGFFGGRLDRCWSGTGVRVPGKNLSLNMVAFSSGVSMAGPVGLCSGGKRAVHLPFRCFSRDQMLAISTALCNCSWAQSCFAWAIVRLRLRDAMCLASFPMVEHANVCAMLHASFHHLALFGSGILFGGVCGGWLVLSLC